MRITLEVMGLKSALTHDVDDVILVIRLGYDVVYPYRLPDYFADVQSRRKRRIGVLENHLERRTDFSQRFAFKVSDVPALENNLPLGDVVKP